MDQPSIDHFKLLLILIGFPVGRSVQILAERLLLEPYPRKAWGSWLLVGWAIALLIAVIQFAFGTVVHSDRLGTSFLFFGFPTILYSLVLLRLVSKMFPKPPPGDLEPAFLLVQFQQNLRHLYSCAFGLAVIPFIIAPWAFGDQLISLPQISRIIMMICFAVGYFTPATRVTAHKVIWFLAFPFIIAIFVLYLAYYGSS